MKMVRFKQVNSQDIKVIFLVKELIKCLLDETAFGHATKYRAHAKIMKDDYWSLNPKIILDLKGNAVGSPSAQDGGGQANIIKMYLYL